MKNDFVSNPQSFAKANAEARAKHLRMLTPVSAAKELEAIFEALEELAGTREELGLAPAPPPRAHPISIAVLLCSRDEWIGLQSPAKRRGGHS